MKRFFLFGQSACNVYNDHGIKGLKKKAKTVDGALFVWTPGETTPELLLSYFVGYNDWAPLTQEEFIQLSHHMDVLEP